MSWLGARPIKRCSRKITAHSASSSSVQYCGLSTMLSTMLSKQTAAQKTLRDSTLAVVCPELDPSRQGSSCKVGTVLLVTQISVS